MNGPDRSLSSEGSAFRTVLLPGMLLAALVGLIAVLVQGYMLVLQEREETRALLARIGEATVPALERALWDVNEPQIEVLLDGIAQSEAIGSVILEDERGFVRRRGEAPAPDAQQQRYVLALDGAENVVLGELRVALEADLGEQRALSRVLRGTIVVALTLLIAIAVLVHLMNAQLVHPLKRLAEAVDAYSPDADGLPSGRSPDGPMIAAAEVQRVAEALDLMHLRIRHDSEEIAQLSENLEVQKDQTEAMVQQRTAELEVKNYELASQAAALESLANTDALTGAASRRKLLELGNRECARALRDARPLAVLAIDIDHFKHVNDTHGHAAGDRVLKIVVACCQSQLRNNDVLGRLGGEEFAVVLPGADTDAAQRVAERIRERIADTPTQLDSATIRVTASIGVATFDGKTPFEALLADADAALYRAKHEGRNRVVVSPAAQA